MPIVQADRLTHVGTALLKAAGASDEEAKAVAVGCVNANLAGHDSHGIIAVPTGIVTAELTSAMRKPVSTEACSHCSGEGHDSDAVFCKYCGSKL